MRESFQSTLVFILLPLLLVTTITLHHHHRHHNTVPSSLALATNSRWIIDERNNGQRVKLSCVNWVSHLDAALAEGLSKQPVDVIAKKILDMGFNCVRLTYPLYLFTDDTLSATTVRQSLQALGLMSSIAGVQANNPSIIDLPLIDAFQEVVSSLNDNNVMIILDNHLSKPGWCCNDNDGNGFFGDLYFDPQVWIKGVTRVATMFRGYTNVVGMSLRNELRGRRQDVKTWYKYMQKCAEWVHAANPDVLVILSGLNYDLDLSFLQKNPVKLSFNNKLVFEAHWYGFSDGDDWVTGNSNEVCGRVIDTMKTNAMFLLDQGYPLFISEWGVDQRGTNENDNRYLNCFLGWAAEHDLDWALWSLVGSYYYREGVVGMEEFYGVLNWNWHETRNSSFLKKISPLQSPFQAPFLSTNGQHKVIFHPSTGLCVQSQSLTLGPCSNAEAWDYTPQNMLTMKSTGYCLQADGVHMSVKVDTACEDVSSAWEAISASKMHLSTKINDGTMVCLDIDSENTLVTNKCKCLSKDLCDPASQWFKVINSTSIGNQNPSL
ncbi:ricin B, lectin domain, Glycoside hydrolase, family 5 [Artemisia annua]|uniref:Ricin B, lectin domain, Glycoside hydrolase, family 5 n=1 Tax=Artemisia annua TaxID=35608 RepID=A0A2U1N680_ARTAN|nr:ricin B, lectin domain, Glycoside hydrolase, family 5 [Artemisia annua]